MGETPHTVNKRKTGEYYEKEAAAYLREQGYRILEMNFRCRQGEIDIIARDGAALVFVEVKYRSGRGSGYALEAVTPSKQRTICRVADYYRVSRRVPEDCPCRFDVTAVDAGRITLIRNAFP